MTMAVTVAPSVEACKAILARIRTGTAYSQMFIAKRPDQAVDVLEDVIGLQVDVVHETEEQLNETLDEEDRTSHDIRVWIRKKLQSVDTCEVDPLKLFVRQVFQRLNQYRTTDQRVRVWEADLDASQLPDKDILKQTRLFVASIRLRVEVEAS